MRADGPTRRTSAVAALVARRARRSGRCAFGRVQQRHRVSCSGAGVDRRVPRTRAATAAVSARPGVRGKLGSAATLIGNPQNMLIGEALRLSFSGYLAAAAVPVALGLLATWAFIAWQTHGKWEHIGAPDTSPERREEAVPLYHWQTAKGLTVAAGIFVAFLFAPWPREIVALTGAGVLLLSRRLHSRHMLGLVDWQLLILFIGLFVVNHAFQETGLPERIVADLAERGIHLQDPKTLFVVTFLLSNIVSNVPAVMLLLPVATHAMAGPVLALSSTLAGNLLLVGSIANLIVADAAERRGIAMDWKRHAWTGVPVTLITLAISAGYLWLRTRGAG